MTFPLPAALSATVLAPLHPLDLDASAVELRSLGESNAPARDGLAARDHEPRKAAVAHVTVTDDGLDVTYQALTWAQWSATASAPHDGPQTDLAWPAIASLHLAVVSCDHQLLLTRRSPATSFFPGAWSASIEEGLDVPADRTLADTTTRAVAEELASPAPDTVRTLAVAREHDPQTGAPWGVVFIAVAHLPVTGRELLDCRTRAVDADEHDHVALVPLGTGHVAAAVAAAAVGAQVAADGWHPTSPTRLELLTEHLRRAR